MRLVDRDGVVAVDAAGSAPGRGTYLCGVGCLPAARRRGAFARRLRAPVRVPEDLEGDVRATAVGPQRR